MSELYICIDCEVNSSVTEPVELDEHGLCSRCKSTSVIACSALRDIAVRSKQENLVRETPPEKSLAWVQAHKDSRRRDSGRLRNYLATLQYAPLDPDLTDAQRVLNADLAEILVEWDGWAWEVNYPWSLVEDEDNSPEPGSWVIELTSYNRVKWLLILDDYMFEIRKTVP